MWDHGGAHWTGNCCRSPSPPFAPTLPAAGYCRISSDLFMRSWYRQSPFRRRRDIELIFSEPFSCGSRIPMVDICNVFFLCTSYFLFTNFDHATNAGPFVEMGADLYSIEGYWLGLVIVLNFRQLKLISYLSHRVSTYNLILFNLLLYII